MVLEGLPAEGRGGEASVSGAFVGAQLLARRKGVAPNAAAFVEATASSKYSERRRIVILMIIEMRGKFRQDAFASPWVRERQ
jgi:hypothetical protein